MGLVVPGLPIPLLPVTNLCLLGHRLLHTPLISSEKQRPLLTGELPCSQAGDHLGWGF